MGLVAASAVEALPSETLVELAGTWVNVAPAGVDLTDNLCGNGGTQSVGADPSNPYAQFNCQGIWKSTNYGATWTGPINAGRNAAQVSDCVGGITVSPSGGPGPGPDQATIYQGFIQGSGIGFWKSVDGGVTWTNPFRWFDSPGLLRSYRCPLHEHDSIV